MLTVKTLSFASAAAFVAGLGTTASAAWTQVDTFDSYDNSTSTALGATPGNITGDKWIGVFNGTGSAKIIDESGSDQVLEITNGVPSQGVNGWRGAVTNLGANTIADNSVATLFFQFRANSTVELYDVMFGLTDATTNVDNANSWQDFAVMPFLAGGTTGVADFRVAEGTIITDVVANQWYNVWLVVDTNNQTFDVYSSTGTSDGVLGWSDSTFRNGLGLSSLAAFGLAQRESGLVQIDNVFITTGQDTTYAVPEPGSLALLGLGGLLIARRRRD